METVLAIVPGASQQARLILEAEAGPHLENSDLRCLWLGLRLASRGFVDLGPSILALSGASGVPRAIQGWHKDRHDGYDAFGVMRGRSGDVVVQQNCGRGAIWSVEQVDLRRPFVVSFEFFIHNTSGGVHVALSENRRMWEGPNGHCDALSIAILKRDTWEHRCDVIWIRSRMFAEEVALVPLRYGTWPRRTWGACSLNFSADGCLEVVAFEQTAHFQLQPYLQVQPGIGRAVAGLPPLVHVGVIGWDHESRADIRELCIHD